MPTDFCGIIPIFQADFCIMISDVKIPAKNNFNKVPDKIKGVCPISTPIYIITGSEIVKKDLFVYFY